MTDAPTAEQLVGEVGRPEPLSRMDRFGDVRLPPGSRVTSMSSVGLPDATGLVYSLVFLEVPNRPLTVLLSEQVREDEYRVMSGLDVALSPEEAVVPIDCLLDGRSVPIGTLLTVVPVGSEGDVEPLRAWSVDTTSQTFVVVDATRVACTFAHV